ncbi:MAG: zinc ribbon domain-containing protein [Solirubrobacteraceae bacterium]
MKTAKEKNVEEKLRDLYNLQLIHLRLDNITNLRGELPLEVDDLKDEIAGLEVRKASFENEEDTLTQLIIDNKEKIKVTIELIKKYTKQQDTVRNNREFDSINKEIEYHNLEIELAEKKIRDAGFKIESKSNSKITLTEKLDSLKNHLSLKTKELTTIIAETEKEEAILLKEIENFEKEIEPRLLNSYKKTRARAVNGLAIVSIERGSAQGSYFTIPPQVQLEIAQRKKIVVDEHSGKILIDEELAMNQREKINKLFAK